MKEKLLKLFEDLNSENQLQIVDYALMLWEMEQGEKQLSENLGIKNIEDLKKITDQYLRDKNSDEIN